MANYSKTRQRELLLEVIREADVPITARELLRRATERDSGIGHATVYRNLNLFKQLGIINETRLGQAQCYYEAKNEPEHQHLVCQDCGKVIEFTCPLQEIVEKVKLEKAFTVTRAEIYMTGYCFECSQQKEVEDV